MKPFPDADKVWELFEYSPLTGTLRRRDRGTTGSISNGYISHCVDAVNHYAHRLIWLWMTGEQPAGQVDHKDGNKLNNAWSNLRVVTNAQNGWNKGHQRNSRSKLKGVSPSKKRWKAEIQVNGKRTHLGTFDTPEEAHLAYRQAAKQLHGQFSQL